MTEAPEWCQGLVPRRSIRQRVYHLDVLAARGWVIFREPASVNREEINGSDQIDDRLCRSCIRSLFSGRVFLKR